MKAVVKYAQRDGAVELRKVKIPEIGPEDVLVEVKAAGICGSDIEAWRQRVSFPINVPVIQGHEFSGVIKKIGKDVEKSQVGDKVVCESSAYVCGHCRFCRTGEYQICPERLGFGYGTDGAFTKYVKVRKQILHRMPENVSFEEAAIIEPCCVSYNAVVGRSRIKPGETVAVIGPGPTGLFALQIAKICGASKVIIVGLSKDKTRFQIAEELRADLIVNAEKEDPVKKVLQLTNNVGADLVINAAGSSITLEQSIMMVRRLGQITKIGWGPKPVGFSLDPLISKSATLQGTFGHNWTHWEHVLDLVKKKQLRLKPLINYTFPITEWKRAFSLVEKRQAGKVILKPV